MYSAIWSMRDKTAKLWNRNVNRWPNEEYNIRTDNCDNQGYRSLVSGKTDVITNLFLQLTSQHFELGIVRNVKHELKLIDVFEAMAPFLEHGKESMRRKFSVQSR